MSMKDRLRKRALFEVETSDGAQWQIRPVDGRALIPHGGARSLVALQTAAEEMHKVRAENLRTTVEELAPGHEAVIRMLKKDPELAFEVVNMMDAFVCAGVVGGAEPGSEFEPLTFVTNAAAANDDDVFHVAALPQDIRLELGALIKEESSKGLDIAGFRKVTGSADTPSEDVGSLQSSAA